MGADGHGDGPDGFESALKGWLDGWTRLAHAQADAARALADEPGVAEADALWSALEAQASLQRAAAARAASGARSATGAATLARLLDPGQWLFAGADALDPALRRLIDGPPPSELAEFGRAALPATPQWRALRRARAAHRRLVGEAFARLVARVAAEAAADPALASSSAQARWTEAAEAELDALRRSDAFIASQARLVSAASALRAVEAAMVERWCEARALPSRGEIDDLHRSVTELRRELRALKRALGKP